MDISERSRDSYEVREAERKLRLARLALDAAREKVASTGWFLRKTRAEREREVEHYKLEYEAAQDWHGLLFTAVHDRMLNERAESARRRANMFATAAKVEMELDRTKVVPSALMVEAKRRGFKPVKSFEPGARCCRFWDSSSDNETGCFITEVGVVVLTPHDKPFMSWRDIFGREFVISILESRK